jgi:hypothetical protein
MCKKSERKKQTFVAFLDIEKAYDTLDRSAILDSLKRKGVSSKILRVLKSFYSTVQSCVETTEDHILSDWFFVEAGLRQGCPLSLDRNCRQRLTLLRSIV